MQSNLHVRQRNGTNVDRAWFFCFPRTSRGSLAVLRQKRIRVTLFGQYNGKLCPARCLSVSYWVTD